MNYIFIGTPKFASNILEKLINNGYKPDLVITAPDKPVGRKKIMTPPDVKLIAEKYGIKVQQPDKIGEIEKTDLIILTAYGQIIPKSILDIPDLEAINIHPSLLPKLRGASPIQSAILNGEKKTGVSIYFMDEKMDHGPIIKKEVLDEDISQIGYIELESKLSDLGAKMMIELLPKIKEVKPSPQNESEATFTKILKKEDGKIDWNKDAETIERQIRAFEKWPGSYCLWGDKTIKILKAKVLPNNKSYVIGSIIALADESIAVSCKSNFLIIKELQIEGKKPASIKEFLQGHQEFVGSILK